MRVLPSSSALGRIASPARHAGEMNRIAALQPHTSHRATLPLSTVIQQEQMLHAMADLTAAVGDSRPAAPTHSETFEMIVPFVESLIEQDAADVDLPALALLAFTSLYPGVPELVALQAAFGARAAQQDVDRLARFRAQARQRGLTVDEYVQQLVSAGAVPIDPVVRLFRGDAKRRPDEARISRGVALLRRTLSLLPEPVRPHLLCSLAWLHWARGEQEAALSYLAQATKVERDHVLAFGLALHFARVSPAWLRTRK